MVLDARCGQDYRSLMLKAGQDNIRSPVPSTPYVLVSVML